MKNRTPPRADLAQPLPDFQPVERRYRHDGWTPERQRAFIAALADTGSVSRAAAMVNMTPEGAYYLRRQAGAESFRRAWEAALDFGVQRLKDLAFERAIEGELVPVMSFGKLVGYRRKTNDRLLMFCLRMNAKASDGRRYSQTYFDPSAERLSASPSPLAGEGQPTQPAGRGGKRGLSVSQPLAPTPAEQTDDQANLIRHFDPVHLSLDQIESLQQLLAKAAATRRALEHYPEHDPQVPYLPASQVTDALELGVTEDETGTYHRGGDGEIDWRKLDPEGLAHQAEIDAVIEQMKAETAALSPPRHGEGDRLAKRDGGGASPPTPKSTRRRKAT